MVYLRIELWFLSTGGYMQTCPKCKITKSIKHFYMRPDRIGKAQSYCKQCNHQQVLNRQREFKRKCLEYKGSCCSKCGYSKCIGALEFHHLDPNKKAFAPSKFRHTSFIKNDTVIKKELDKCIVLCSNCHRENHSYQ